MKPSLKCVICQKTLQEIGDARIIAQELRGFTISTKYLGGGNPNHPYRSFPLDETKSSFFVVWGSIWTEEPIQRAIEEYKSGRYPWFCQVYGNRTCDECKKPIPLPMGSDTIHEDGRKSHCPILPANLGCTNSKCSKYIPYDEKEREKFNKKRTRFEEEQQKKSKGKFSWKLTSSELERYNIK
ncbi:MAG: hypothetical protein HQK79_20760 [Desulfobacterales bacterium]|nr:hypothetical protein [Desulfobacterales bacterium]